MAGREREDVAEAVVSLDDQIGVRAGGHECWTSSRRQGKETEAIPSAPLCTLKRKQMFL